MGHSQIFPYLEDKQWAREIIDILLEFFVSLLGSLSSCTHRSSFIWRTLIIPSEFRALNRKFNNRDAMGVKFSCSLLGSLRRLKKTLLEYKRAPLLPNTGKNSVIFPYSVKYFLKSLEKPYIKPKCSVKLIGGRQVGWTRKMSHVQELDLQYRWEVSL
jgi:hypothetical protein